ncbi:MAG: hypothetical protein RLZ98_3724, partial [Pseudomonadota bacterium]
MSSKGNSSIARGATPEVESAQLQPFRTRVKIKTEAHVPDDLTAIRGVDKSLAAQLAGLGITRFRQIAEWEPQHVREVS